MGRPDTKNVTLNEPGGEAEPAGTPAGTRVGVRPADGWGMDGMISAFFVSFAAAFALMVLLFMSEAVDSMPAFVLALLPVAASLVAFGVLFCARAFSDRRRARATEGWSPVEAPATSATRVEQQRDRRRKGAFWAKTQKEGMACRRTKRCPTGCA